MLSTAVRERFMSCWISHDPAHVRHARQQARKALCAWDLDDHADLAELIVSDLATNAIRHAEGPVRIRLSSTRRKVRVEVHDNGADQPVRRQPDANDEAGRGVALIDGLIGLHGGRRGVANEPGGQGKVVYVVICLASGPDGRQLIVIGRLAPCRALTGHRASLRSGRPAEIGD